MKELGFELTGIMPLLMHADDIDAADTLMAWRKDPEALTGRMIPKPIST